MYHFNSGTAVIPVLLLPFNCFTIPRIKINLDLRPIDECLWAVSIHSSVKLMLQIPLQKLQPHTSNHLLLLHYMLTMFSLTLMNAAAWLKILMNILIEQLQFTGDESVGSSSNKIKLNFNHPCKELIWVVQPDANVDYCASLICGNYPFLCPWRTAIQLHRCY